MLGSLYQKEMLLRERLHIRGGGLSEAGSKGAHEGQQSCSFLNISNDNQILIW